MRRVSPQFTKPHAVLHIDGCLNARDQLAVPASAAVVFKLMPSHTALLQARRPVPHEHAYAAEAGEEVGK